MTNEQVVEYLKGLKPGEQVIETGNSCMKGKKGVVYIGQGKESKGSICVMWEGGMGTSATWGTRRITDTKPKATMLEPLIDAIPHEQTTNLPYNTMEVVRNSEDELHQSPEWIDPYRIKSKVFERNGQFVFRVYKIDADTYGP